MTTKVTDLLFFVNGALYICTGTCGANLIPRNDSIMMIKKNLDPKNDYAFKQIFGQEKNKDILIKLINTVLKSQLHQQVVDVTFLNPV